MEIIYIEWSIHSYWTWIVEIAEKYQDIPGYTRSTRPGKHENSSRTWKWPSRNSEFSQLRYVNVYQVG